MTDAGLFSLFLFLHVLGAIVAFGPALSFSVIGAYGGKEPQHSNFTVRLSKMLSERVVIPVALTMPITGAAMIWVAKIDLAARQNWWLGLGIVLYVIAILFAVFVQVKNAERLIELTSGGPPPGAGGPPAGGPPPGASGTGPRPGPPPHIAAALKRVQQGGIVLTVLIVTIVLLMVVKPRF
jgi:hypothetical protein